MTASLRVELFPANLDRSIAFYEALGFSVRGRSDDPVPYAVVQLGAVRIGLLEASVLSPDPVEPSARWVPSGAELVVEVDDVRATRDGAVAHGVELAEDLVEREWGLTDFRVHDPDGYYLRFSSRRD